jgi:hypothetical protein
MHPPLINTRLINIQGRFFMLTLIDSICAGKGTEGKARGVHSITHGTTNENSSIANNSSQTRFTRLTYTPQTFFSLLF